MSNSRRSIISLPRNLFAGYSSRVGKSIIVLKKSQRAVNSLFSVYTNIQQSRTSNKGMTEREGDVLRAMLVFSASGLDSVVKQLIRDALLDVTKKNCEVQKQLEKFIEKRIRTKNSDGVETVDTKVLSNILATPSPYERIIQIEIEELTSGSLQSKDELLKIATTFAIQPSEITNDLQKLKEIFDTRNQIIHEMDINFKLSTSKRRNRNGETLCSYSNELIQVGINFIKAVNERLR